MIDEIVHQPTANKLAETPITADNNIVFINRDSIIRRPREFKTPPPPMYGEEDEYEVNPRESFYDPLFDPNKKKFNFLDGRQGSVSGHYKKYIDSKTMKKRKKKYFKNKNDSLSESEINDTIGELPGFTVQQGWHPNDNRRMVTSGHANSPPLQRSLSQTSSHRFIDRNHCKKKNEENKTLYRNNSFKAISPHIINDPIMRKAPAPIQEKASIGSLTSRPIRSGAFQRINSKRLLNKY